jgi:hypothetical protein
LILLTGNMCLPKGGQLSLERSYGPRIAVEPGLREGTRTGLPEAIEQAIKVVAMAEGQNEFTGFGSLAFGWQTVIVNTQIEGQSAQVLAIEVFEDELM